MTELVSITSLWLPILVAAVVVFVASAIVWMVLPHHKKDWGQLPGEDGLMEAMRSAGVKQGQYGFPSFGGDMEVMKTPEFQKKLEAGPVGFMTVGPNGPPNMGKALGQWFVYVVFVSTFVAYLAGRVVAPGGDYLAVFRIAGTTAVLAYSSALVPNAIFKSQPWGYVIKEMTDGVVYGLLTAGIFASMWPSA